VEYLKSKHTPRAIEESISNAARFLNDYTPMFITTEGSSFEGTRHLGSLMKICDALEVKVGMGGSGKDALSECTSLLERKMQLMKEVYGV
jgi:hypothetical protein